MGFGNIGLSELIPIFLLILILFGAKRLPEFGRSLGGAIREFKKSVKEINSDVSADEPKPPRENRPEPPSNKPIG